MMCCSPDFTHPDETFRQKQIDQEKRIWLEADWDHVPVGKTKVPLTISGAGKSLLVYAEINKSPVAISSQLNFLPKGSCLALEADQYAKAVPASAWQVLPGYGRTRSGVTAIPVNAPSASLTASSPYLAYEFSLQDSGTVEFSFLLSPTLDFLNKGGLLYGVSVDDQAPQTINMQAQEGVGEGARGWERSVANSIRQQKLKFNFSSGGKHTLKFWRIDPGVVLQKILMDSGGLAQSYLGVPAAERSGRPAQAVQTTTR